MPSEEMIYRLMNIVDNAVQWVGDWNSRVAVDFVLVSLTDEDIAALAAERGMVIWVDKPSDAVLGEGLLARRVDSALVTPNEYMEMLAGNPVKWMAPIYAAMRRAAMRERGMSIGIKETSPEEVSTLREWATPSARGTDEPEGRTVWGNVAGRGEEDQGDAP